MAQKFLCVYHDWLATFQGLGYERAGRLLVAALEYDINGKPPDLDGNLKFVWPLIQASIDRNHEHYKNICETNRRNVSSRYDRIRPNTTEYDRSKENTTEEKKTEEKRIEPKKADAFREFAGEDETLLQALRDFSAMRTKIKRPLTPAAQTRLLSRLKKDFSPAEWVPVLNQSVDHCWQDLYPLKKEEQPQPPRTSGKNVQTTPAPTVADQVKKYGPIGDKLSKVLAMMPDIGGDL